MQDHSQPQKEVLEFDLKELSDRKCRELERYVNNCLKSNMTLNKGKNVNSKPAAGASVA
jgi:hypothetical protein